MFEATSTRFLRALGAVLLLAAALALLGRSLLGGEQASRLDMLERDHSRMQAKIRRAQRDNTQLSEELARLQHGVGGWQEIARREHGMILPGEVVFRFPVER